MEAIGSPPATTPLLSTREIREVAGTPDDAGRLLQAAGADEAVGVNPAHVVTVTGGGRSRPASR